MKKSLLLVFCFFVVVSFVNAGIAVSSFYSDNLHLELRPGESMETDFLIQSIETDELITVKTEISQGLDFVSFVNENLEYAIAPGERIEVPVRVEIPLGYEAGEYSVGVFFIDATPEVVDGAVSFAFNVQKSFPLTVLGDSSEVTDGDVTPQPTDEEPLFSIRWLIGGVSIIIIAIIIWIIMVLIKRRKMEQSIINMRNASGLSAGIN